MPKLLKPLVFADGTSQSTAALPILPVLSRTAAFTAAIDTCYVVSTAINTTFVVTLPTITAAMAGHCIIVSLVTIGVAGGDTVDVTTTDFFADGSRDHNLILRGDSIVLYATNTALGNIWIIV